MSAEPTLFDSPDECPSRRRGPRPRHALVIDQYKVKAPAYPRSQEWWQQFTACRVVASVDDHDQTVTLIADARLSPWCPKPPTQQHYNMYWSELYARFTDGVLAKYFTDALTVVDLP